MRPLALATAARACDGGPRIAIDLPSGDPKVSATITASQPQATSAIAPAILLNLRSAPLEPFPFRLNRNGALSFCFDAFSSREPVSTSLENALVIIEMLNAGALCLQVAVDINQALDASLQTGPAKPGFGVEVERKQLRGVLHVELRCLGRDDGDEDFAIARDLGNANALVEQ